MGLLLSVQSVYSFWLSLVAGQSCTVLGLGWLVGWLVVILQLLHSCTGFAVSR
jgi:hypothetical protein